MDINLENLVLVEISGKGHYSGRTKSCCCFFTKDLADKYTEQLTNFVPFFYELDGKHSEVEGVTNIIEGTDSILCTWHFADTTGLEILDNFRNFITLDNFKVLKELNMYMKENFEVKTQTTYTYSFKDKENANK